MSELVGRHDGILRSQEAVEPGDQRLLGDAQQEEREWRSTSTRTPKISTTSSRPKNVCESPWRCSKIDFGPLNWR